MLRGTSRRLPTRAAENGFTLIEVLLAMFLVALVMASLIGVLLSSLSTITQARQRQVATSLATQALEQLRALPYDDITQPNGTDVEPGLTNITGSHPAYTFAPAALTGVTEPLVVNDFSGHWEDHTLDGVTYRVQTYVTQPPPGPSGEQTFNLTALTTWSSSVSNGERTVAQRSVAYSPAGCLSTAQTPFAAPCQAYFTAQAGSVPSGISVANSLNSTAPVEGFTSGHLLDLTLANLDSTLLLEQTASATASARTSQAREEGFTVGSSGGVSTVVSVDSDPSSVEGQEGDQPTLGQTSAVQELSGTAGTLSLRPSTADSGRAAAAVSASSVLCTGADGTGLATGPATELRPCASSNVQPKGTGAHLQWTPPTASGLTAVDLATLAPSTTPWRSVAANLAAANPSACAVAPGPTTLGCAHAASRRTVGDVAIGAPGSGPVGLPAGYPAGSIPLVTVSGLTESARAEDGEGAAVPSYGRGGSVSVWDGTSHFPIDLATTPNANVTVPATTFEYTHPSGTYYVTYEGSVVVQGPTTERTPTARTGDPVADCKDDACVSRVSGASGVVVNLLVTITEVPYDPTSVDPPLGRFTMGTNLGGLTATASYQAAPNA